MTSASPLIATDFSGKHHTYWLMGCLEIPYDVTWTRHLYLKNEYHYSALSKLLFRKSLQLVLENLDSLSLRAYHHQHR